MSPEIVVCYAIVGTLAVIVSLFFTDDHPDVFPPGSLPAVRFVVWLLWPLFLAGVILVGIAAVIVAIVRGFVAMYRAWRPRREGNHCALHDDCAAADAIGLPRAIAKERRS